MTSRCLLCATIHEPYATPTFKGSLIARYRCLECRIRWLVCWDTTSPERAA